MSRPVLIALLVIGAAASEDPSAFQEPELLASSIPASLSEASVDQSVDQPKYKAQELDKGDIKRMTPQQQHFFEQAHMGKRWVMHGARKAGEHASKLMHKAEKNAQTFQNRVNLLGEMPKRMHEHGKRQFNMALGKDEEHPFGNPATIMAGSRDRALRQLGNKMGLHTFLRDMSMTKEQQQHLEKLQDAAFEAGKEFKKDLQPLIGKAKEAMGIPEETPKKKDPTKMYRNQLLSMMDSENPYSMKKVKGNGCGIMDKDSCETVSGCVWIHHSCDSTRRYLKPMTERKVQSNIVKDIAQRDISFKPDHRNRAGIRHGHNFYRSGKEKRWHHAGKTNPYTGLQK